MKDRGHILQVLKQARRFCPEALNFIMTLLVSALPSQADGKLDFARSVVRIIWHILTVFLVTSSSYKCKILPNIRRPSWHVIVKPISDVLDCCKFAVSSIHGGDRSRGAVAGVEELKKRDRNTCSRLCSIDDGRRK